MLPDRRPERIPAILGELQALWQKYPDLRLGQLLINSLSEGQDLFYVEDRDLLDKVQDFIRRMDT